MLAYTSTVLPILGVLAVGGLVLWQGLTQIDVDSDSFPTTIDSAVASTLEGGDAEQRVELILQLEQLGTDADAFVPHLVACTDDDDPSVRHAARSALRRIDPSLLDETESYR